MARASLPRLRELVPGALRAAGIPTMVLQPVVDLERGVPAGWEALARFPGSVDQPPDAWFRAAADLGLGAELEAKALAAALAWLDALPPATFLSVNVSPALLASPPVREVLEGLASLDRVVVELTEHVPVEDYAQLAGSVERLRAAGASVAVDDAGAGYASLSHILAIRPSFVKVDRVIVDGCDRDGGKLALIEMLGTFASRIDAWVVAEGVERREELDALVRLGVPLAQGWLFGRPDAGWPAVPATLTAQLRDLAAARCRTSSVGALLERAPGVEPDRAGEAFDADAAVDWVVVLDERGWPVGVQHRDHPLPRPPMRVLPSNEVAVIARRAMTRPDPQRFDPLVCCDELGVYLGVVRIERLVERLSGDPD